MEFDRYTLVLLRRPPDSPGFSDAELEELQAAHLGHLAAMHERGALAVAGPFEGQSDETLRGLCVYTVQPDEARRLAEQDPSVRARRMAAEVLTWCTPPGELRQAAPCGLDSGR
jgi:uncharacterized protein YciI